MKNLIVDMSNDFVDDKGALRIVSQILLRIEDFYNNHELIVFCMDSHSKNDTHFKLWAPHNVKGSWKRSYTAI